MAFQPKKITKQNILAELTHQFPRKYRSTYIEASNVTADIKQVLQDVLALTNLNFNGCMYADEKPVTLDFATFIGLILKAAQLEKKVELPLSFKQHV